jgi:hypothetical protein
MTELAHLVTGNDAPFQEQRRNKLQDALRGIPPENCRRAGDGQGTAHRTQIVR